MFALDQFKIKTIDENSERGVFEIAPLPRGYGHTLGSVLRRILLSSIPGTAITAVKFKDVQHEYTTLADVQDDVLSLVLSFKELAVHSNSDEPVTLKLKVKGSAGKSTPITAGDIDTNSQVEIINPAQVITHVNGATTLDLELIVEKGVGFAPASDDARNEIGLIPLGADFSPVRNAIVEISQTRVGQMTDLDKLTLTIVTNGAVKPSVVLHQAGQVINQLSSNLLDNATGVLTGDAQGLIGTRTETTAEPVVGREPISIAELGLSNRLTNALLRAGYGDLTELEGMADEEIANIKGMGAKSLTELKSTMDKYGVKHI